MMVSSKLLTEKAKIAELLAMLGNEKRLAIIYHLAKNEMPVGTLAERVGLSQSALSQHLAKLRNHDLVDTRRERQMIYYSCSSPEIHRLLASLDTVFGET